MKKLPTIFVSTNSFFKELKKFYNPTIPWFITDRCTCKRESENTKWSLRTYPQLNLFPFISYYSLLNSTPSKQLSCSLLLLGLWVCFPYARDNFPHLFSRIYLRFYLNSSRSIIQLQHSSHSIKIAQFIGLQDGLQHSPHLKLYPKDCNLFIISSLTLKQ